MLQSLHIKNLILIKELNIDFTSGLNVITGETGAGKSMLMNSLNILLGKKIQLDNKPDKKTSVQAVFDVSCFSKSKLITILDDLGIECEDNELIIRRDIFQGRSRSYINSVVVNNSILKQICQYLVDIHGQHDHQSLLNPKKHIDFLDGFTHIEDDILLYQKYFNDYKLLLDKKNILQKDFEDTKNNIEFLQYQKKELESISLDENEVNDLYNKRNKLKNHNSFFELISNTEYVLNEKESSLLEMLEAVKKNIEKISDLDKNYLPYIPKLENILCDLYDIKDTVECSNKMDVFDPALLDNIEESLFRFEELKRKYKKDISELCIYYEEVKTKILQFEDVDFNIEKIDKEIETAFLVLTKQADIISDKRIKCAKKIKNSIEAELKELGISQAEFDIKINKSDFNNKGQDVVEFYISTNKGMTAAPLVRIASGGEISRIMLALKTVFAKSDIIPTLVFDEIDSGVGGKTAKVVGEKLKKLSKYKQILCITHLPQVASNSDSHFAITKKVENKETFVYINKLSEKKRVSEIARMLGGEELTSVTLKHAEELLNVVKN